MSIGPAKLNQVLSGGLAQETRGGKAVEKASDMLFRSQMNLVQQIAGLEQPDGDTTEGQGLQSFMGGDSLMYDSMATIARLTGGGSLGGRLAGLTGGLGGGYGKSTVRASGAEGSSGGLGQLSAMFESGTEGVGSIGYDATGGTSYGTYQLSSKAGTMGRFLSYLDQHAPDIAKTLRAAGRSDTGSKRGAMPEAWRKVAAAQPERFEKLQHEFIRDGHFEAARKQILEQTGVDLDEAPAALKEVLWSTAVQHGATGAARIFNRSIDKLLGNDVAEGDFQRGLIKNVYALRSRQFGSSTQEVRQSVVNRLARERELALNMLNDGGQMLA